MRWRSQRYDVATTSYYFFSRISSRVKLSLISSRNERYRRFPGSQFPKNMASHSPFGNTILEFRRTARLPLPKTSLLTGNRDNSDAAKLPYSYQFHNPNTPGQIC